MSGLDSIDHVVLVMLENRSFDHMLGFLYPKLAGAVPASIMGMYAAETLPVLSGLAKGFAVCDGWFASVPTQTFPNRAFAVAGTSLGPCQRPGPTTPWPPSSLRLPQTRSSKPDHPPSARPRAPSLKQRR